MANIKSVRKHILQSEKKRKQNMSFRSEVRTYIKKVNAAISNSNKEKAKKMYKIMQIKLDKSVSKKLFHKNTVARYKSNILRRIKLLK